MQRHNASVTAGLTNRMQQDEVGMIARWIDEGAKDNQPVTFAAHSHCDL